VASSLPCREQRKAKKTVSLATACDQQRVKILSHRIQQQLYGAVPYGAAKRRNVPQCNAMHKTTHPVRKRRRIAQYGPVRHRNASNPA